MLRRSTPSPQPIALEYCRSLSDEDWRRFKRAVEGYRKADRILSGEDADGDVNDLGEQLLET